MILAVLICFLDVLAPQEIYDVSLRLDGVGQCCGTSENNCTSTTTCTSSEPECCPNFACCNLSVYADCRVASCFCQIQSTLIVDPTQPCIDDAAIGEVRSGWVRWLVLETPGQQGYCGPIR